MLPETLTMRIGFGYDVHRFQQGRPLLLGGVLIPWEKGLAGHSDADVLLHAISDALLGAAALGDIGQLFPDTEERWKDADSLRLLKVVGRRVREAGYQVGNVDATVALQQPRLSPHLGPMRENIAEALTVSTTRISVKATTTEKLGYIGEGEGASAQAVCLLEEE